MPILRTLCEQIGMVIWLQDRLGVRERHLDLVALATGGEPFDGPGPGPPGAEVYFRSSSRSSLEVLIGPTLANGAHPEGTAISGLRRND